MLLQLKNCPCCKKTNIHTLCTIPYHYLPGFAEKTWEQQIAICEDCQFIFTQNPFSPKMLDERYKNESKYEFSSKDYALARNIPYEKRCYRQKEFIKRSIDLPLTSIFEIGATNGFNLSLYTDLKTYGVEPSKENTQVAKNQFDITLFQGTFEEYLATEKNEMFDLVFVSHTLEHIVNPFDFISACRKITNKYLFIEVPTLDYRFVDAPFEFFCDEHVNYFTLESLSTLLAKAGFSLVNSEIALLHEPLVPAGSPALCAIFKKEDLNTKIFCRQSIFSPKDLIEAYCKTSKTLLDAVNERIKEISNTEKLALFGISNHSAKLLAATCLAEKNIVKVYDSDRKKARYTVKNIAITPFNPDDIENGIIDSIIITTYSGQKAIYSMLEPFKNRIKIYTLYAIP